jgi:hypothetical protein
MIKGKIWFSPAGSMPLIGIVKVENKMGEIKYYIGTGLGVNEEEDARYISMYGAHFPFESGEKLFNL